MKKEIWFNKRNRVTARDLIAMYRGLGYTDEQIKAEMLKIKAAQQSVQADGVCAHEYYGVGQDDVKRCLSCGAILPRR